MGNVFPKISIVTPSYNQAPYLEQTILSVINQNYPNLEYIIIDGGSTDGSVEIIKKYETHLTFWVSEKDNGLYHGVHKGFEKSTGEIMAWINSDDLYHRNNLFAVAKIFTEQHNINWIIGKNSWYNEKGCTLQLKYNPLDGCWSKWRFLTDYNNHIQQESVFWRRKLWEKTGSYISQQYKLAGDFELWSRFFEHAPLISCNFYLAGFRIRDNHQKSLNQIEVYKKEQLNILLAKRNDGKVRKKLFFIKIGFALLKLLPTGRLKNKVITRILGLNPVLFYEPREGFKFVKPYRL